MLDFGTVLSEPFEREPRRVRAAGRFSWGNANRFWLGVGFAVVLGAAGRFAYLFHGAPRLVLSDGFAYHADYSPTVGFEPGSAAGWMPYVMVPVPEEARTSSNAVLPW
jgi:hypothetical protein